MGSDYSITPTSLESNHETIWYIIFIYTEHIFCCFVVHAVVFCACLRLKPPPVKRAKSLLFPAIMGGARLCSNALSCSLEKKKVGGGGDGIIGFPFLSPFSFSLLVVFLFLL